MSASEKDLPLTEDEREAILDNIAIIQKHLNSNSTDICTALRTASAINWHSTKIDISCLEPLINTPEYAELVHMELRSLFSQTQSSSITLKGVKTAIENIISPVADEIEKANSSASTRISSPSSTQATPSTLPVRLPAFNDPTLQALFEKTAEKYKDSPDYKTTRENVRRLLKEMLESKLSRQHYESISDSEEEAIEELFVEIAPTLSEYLKNVRQKKLNVRICFEKFVHRIDAIGHKPSTEELDSITSSIIILTRKIRLFNDTVTFYKTQAGYKNVKNHMQLLLNEMSAAKLFDDEHIQFIQEDIQDSSGQPKTLIKKEIVDIALWLASCLKTRRLQNKPTPDLSFLKLLVKCILEFEETDELPNESDCALIIEDAELALEKLSVDVPSSSSTNTSPSADETKATSSTSSGGGGSSTSPAKDKTAAASIVVNGPPAMIIGIMTTLGSYNQTYRPLLQEIHYTAKKTMFLYNLLKKLQEKKPHTQENLNNLIKKFKIAPKISRFKSDAEISNDLLEAFISNDMHPNDLNAAIEEALDFVGEEKSDNPTKRFNMAMSELSVEIFFISTNPLVPEPQKKALCSIINRISNELRPLAQHKTLQSAATRLLELTLIGIENLGLSAEEQKEYLETVKTIESYSKNHQGGRLFILAIGFLSILAFITASTLALMAFSVIPATYFGLTTASILLSKTATVAAVCISALVASYCKVIYEGAFSLSQTGMFAYKINEKEAPVVDNNKRHSASPPSLSHHFNDE